MEQTTGLITTLKEEKSEIRFFLEKSTSNFIDELNNFIKDNDDPTMLGYCTEMSLLGLFISSQYKHMCCFSALQEYKSGIKRCDAFIKYKANAIWMEAKFKESNFINPLEHWSIDGWLENDKTNILSQLKNYYERDANNSSNKDVYSFHYLITMTFHILNEPYDKHIKMAKKEITPSHLYTERDRDWYYIYYYLPESEKEGIEIYGTVEKVYPKIN